MTLRILFTLAILVGLAAAPSAQTFRWEANSRRNDVGERVERALERARQRVDRTWERLDRDWQRRVDQARRTADRRAVQIDRQVRQRVARQVAAEVRAATRVVTRVNRSSSYYRSDSRSRNFIDMQTGSDADPCANNNRYGDDDYEQHCEVRDSTMGAGLLTVDGGQNGSIVVEAWDRNEIRVRAVVRGQARTAERAREIAGSVQVQSGGGRVSASGPDSGRREWWSVSYRINVPRKNDLDLNASNGGITITGVTGNLKFDTTNGGVRLTDLGGRVSGSTRNGGLTVSLTGSRWDGEGIDVETSNGGVTVAVPDGYNAALDASTTNGGMSIDFPITVQGNLTGRRTNIQTTLGSGGPEVRVRTTNGGVRINRR